MKKTIHVILFAFFLCNFAFAQSGWVLQNPYPTGSVLLNVKFLNDNTGYIVGENVILKTINGGQSYIFQSSPGNDKLNSVWFTDANTGYIVGGNIGGTSNDGVILKTINGGNNWNTISSGLPTLWGLCFINANTGFASGTNGTILKTVNAGQNWTIISSPTTVSLWSIHFYNEMTGYIAGGTFNPNAEDNLGDGLILKTTNGGNSWSAVLTGYNSTLFSVMFPNANTGYASGTNGAILKTTNGGSNWSILNSGTDKYFFGLYATDASIVTVCGISMYGSNGGILRTTNGGANWYNCLSPSDTTSFLISVNYSGSNTGYAVGSGGKILKTVNGGANWTSLSSSVTSYDIEGIYFINDIGYAIANDDYITNIIYTSNGGNIWTLKNSFNNYELNEVFFINASTGFVCGRTYYDNPNDTGIVLKTTNGGNTWVRKLTTSTSGNSFNTIYFADNNTGYVLGGGNQAFFKTTDGGNTWNNFNIAFNYCSVQASSFINANTGFIGGCTNFGKTTDGGLNWLVFGNVFVHDINTVFAVDQINIYVAGESNIIYKSSNGGYSWNPYILSGYPNTIFQSIYFPNSNTGYAVGGEETGNGQIFATNNSGNNWTKQEINYSPRFKTVFFVSPNTGYVAGKDGIIYKTTTGGIGITNISTEVPEQFSLTQNYPNPFNPSTKFNVKVAKLSEVKVIVYDVLGREIATLVNEQLRAGIYEVSWDARGYTSGVYFYRLTAGDFTETKKMILIK